MQQLTSRHGAGTVLRALRFVGIRTRAFAETQTLAAEVATERETLVGRHEAWLEARENRVAGFAVVTWRDDELDAAVMRLSRNVLATVDGDRADPRWRRLFSSAPSAALQSTASDSQGMYVQALLAGLREQPDNPWPALEKTLRAASSTLETALASRNAAALAEARARAELDIALDAGRRFYNHLYPRTLVALDGRAAAVESCFAKLRRKRKRSGGEVASTLGDTAARDIAARDTAARDTAARDTAARDTAKSGG